MALYDPPARLYPADNALLAARADPAATAQRVGVTVEQVLNLARLAEYLRGLPLNYGRFRMATFMIGGRGDPKLARPLPHCGAVACAVGHGVSAGVEPLPGGEGWAEYCRRAFGADMYYAKDVAHSRLWDFLFSNEWSYYDNTARGAAARVCLVLTEGIPPVYRAIYDEARACYAQYKD